MTLILNDIWQQFNREILSQDDTDYTKKILAINTANQHLLTRWMQLSDQESWPKEFLTEPTNIPNAVYSNKVDLPSDFLRIDNVWYKSGGSATDTVTYTAVTGSFVVGDVITGGITGSIATVSTVATGSLTVAMNSTSDYFLTGETISNATLTATGITTNTITNSYIPMNRSQFTPWDVFVRKNSMLLFNPTVTGNYFSYFSINNKKLYLDRHIAEASTNLIKVSYWKLPSQIYLNDKATVTIITGTTTGAYSVLGQTSMMTANISSIIGNVIYIDHSTSTGVFTIGEKISILDKIGNGVATASLDAYVDLYQPLEWCENNKLLFIEACVFCYFKLRQLDEAVQHDVILTNMIEMMTNVNKNDMARQWRFTD